MGMSKKSSMELEVSASGSLKCKTWVLRVPFHCDGCKRQVKRALQKLKGVYEVKLDSDQSKVTVIGNVSSDILLKKLLEKGKHAEIVAENSSLGGKTKGNNGTSDKPNGLQPVKDGAAAATMANRGTMEEQTRTNSRVAQYYSNGNGPNQGSASLRGYSRSPQQPGTPAATKYGHGHGLGHGNVVPNNRPTEVGTHLGLAGSGSSKIINRQYNNFSNKVVSGAPVQVTGWANARPSKNQWVAYEHQTAHRHGNSPVYRANTITPSQAAAPRPRPILASSNVSILGYNGGSGSGRGYSDHYHQYIPSQPSAYSDVVPPEKISRRRSSRNSNDTSLDIFSEENPNACSIM